MSELEPITQGRLEDWEDYVTQHAEKQSAAHYRRITIEGAVAAGILAADAVPDDLSAEAPHVITDLAAEIAEAINEAKEPPSKK